MLLLGQSLSLFFFPLLFFFFIKKKILGVSEYSLVSVSEAHQRKLKSCIFLEHFLRQPSVEANYILSVYFFFLLLHDEFLSPEGEVIFKRLEQHANLSF